MANKIKDDAYHAQKIHFYCQSIIDFTQDQSYESFKKNEQLNFAVSFALMQIGEEATKLTDDFRIKHTHSVAQHYWDSSQNCS